MVGSDKSYVRSDICSLADGDLSYSLEILSETLEVIDGKVYIDGSSTPLDEDAYIKVDAIGDYGPVTIPENSYFMMGDNRNYSADSRFWVHPFVEREKILGKAVFRYWRFSEIGPIK